jgi:hypothetical protein
MLYINYIKSKLGGFYEKKEAVNGVDSYDAFKDYQGVKYTGVKIGRGHSCNYEAGEWKEKKITPDLWEFNYTVKKHRKRKAPEGASVPVGTEYHWKSLRPIKRAKKFKLGGMYDKK